MKITEEMKRTARQADIVALCQLMGETLFIENEAKGEYRIKGANGLLIWKNCYYWFGSPTGDGRLEGQPPNTSNNTLSFAMYYYGKSFREAIILLCESKLSSTPLKIQAQAYKKAQAQQIVAPAKAIDNKQIIRYLIQERGLDQEIVLEVINKGLLYQEAEHNNCVFVCKNSAGTITGYEVKGILKTKFQRNYGNGGIFNLVVGEPINLWVFESAIDLLSLYELGKKAGDLDNVLLSSMGGLSKAEKIRQIALTLKSKNPNSFVKIAVDNDKSGTDFADSFKERNTDLNVEITTPKSIKGNNFKDWNEILVFKKFR